MKPQVALLLSLALCSILVGCSSSGYSETSSRGNVDYSKDGLSVVASSGSEETSAGADENDSTVEDENEMGMARNMLGLEISIPSGWNTEHRGENYSFKPEGVEGVEMRLWCESDQGSTKEESLERVRTSNDQLEETHMKKEGCKLLDSKTESIDVNGIDAELVTYDFAYLPEGVEARCGRVGFGLPQRCVYMELKCEPELFDKYADAFENTYQSVRCPEIEGREARKFVDEPEKLHIDMPEYSFELPESWLGRVDVVKRSNGTVSVYPAGDYTCGIMAARVSPDDQVTGGDQGSGTFYKEAMGNGRTVILSVTRYPCLAVMSRGYTASGEDALSSLGISDDVAEEAIDLETGGRTSLDEIEADSEAQPGDYFDVVQDYMAENIAPTLATHPDGSMTEHFGQWAGGAVDHSAPILTSEIRYEDLRFEIPAYWVENEDESLPFDYVDPTYNFGIMLGHEGREGQTITDSLDIAKFNLGRYPARESVWGCAFKDYVGESSTVNFRSDGAKAVHASYEMASLKDSTLYHVHEVWYALPDDAVTLAMAYPAVSGEPGAIEYIRAVETLVDGSVKAYG